jgi:hypothetical protein
LSSAEMMIAFDALGRQVRDERDLEVGLGLVRADLGDGAAELAGGLVDAGLRGGEVLVDDVLRQVADGDRRRRLPRGRGRCGAGADGRREEPPTAAERAPRAAAGAGARAATLPGRDRPDVMCFKTASSYC